ncbi:dihydrodipicolinate synthase family protein [Photobacterium rosenbergii]|uniref:dihydrodipicolinate synthase family protein n=1 Tax=Photobacterium rosenbergii TaxID=294936 RepID=UPI001C997539|nr:dihydrodipicolinate synthase family protein [Photobacterium rosenbergii]MBY5944650.1 dihydrodipicolinate synthase family protein [Photobacterium rosenbergii]
MKIAGNWATLLLPLNNEAINEEVIDFDRLAAQIDYYIETKVDGIYSNGTAGEFYTQTEEEFQQISQLLADKCHQAGMPFQIGASHCHPNDSVARAQFAASLNPTAIQVILPNWFPCNTETALTFLKKVESVCNGVPLILYNPPHAKVCLSAQQLKTLFDEVETLVGFKLPRITDEIAATGLAQNAAIFVAGHFLATDAYKGASGAYSNVCCLGPKATQAWTQACLALHPSALETEAQIQQFMSDNIAPLIETEGYCNAAADKFMASLGGWSDISAEMRFPFKGIPAEYRASAQAAQRELIPDFTK